MVFTIFWVGLQPSSAPSLWVGVALATGSTRISILSILVLLVAGGLILTRVNIPDGDSHQEPVRE